MYFLFATPIVCKHSKALNDILSSYSKKLLLCVQRDRNVFHLSFFFNPLYPRVGCVIVFTVLFLKIELGLRVNHVNI